MLLTHPSSRFPQTANNAITRLSSVVKNGRPSHESAPALPAAPPLPIWRSLMLSHPEEGATAGEMDRDATPGEIFLLEVAATTSGAAAMRRVATTRGAMPGEAGIAGQGHCWTRMLMDSTSAGQGHPPVPKVKGGGRHPPQLDPRRRTADAFVPHMTRRNVHILRRTDTSLGGRTCPQEGLLPFLLSS